MVAIAEFASTVLCALTIPSVSSLCASMGFVLLRLSFMAPKPHVKVACITTDWAAAIRGLSLLSGTPLALGFFAVTRKICRLCTQFYAFAFFKGKNVVICYIPEQGLGDKFLGIMETLGNIMSTSLADLLLR